MNFYRIINLILLILLSHSFASAKPLPPGTGNAVPANILFLLDKPRGDIVFPVPVGAIYNINFGCFFISWRFRYWLLELFK